MFEQERLRQRIQSIRGELADCREERQRERLIGQLLDAQDQLMFLNLAPQRQRRVVLKAV